MVCLSSFLGGCGEVGFSWVWSLVMGVFVSWGGVSLFWFDYFFKSGFCWVVTGDNDCIILAAISSLSYSNSLEG